MALTQDFYIRKRKELMAALPEDSLAVVYAGNSVPKSLDADYPFYASSHYRYLTGLTEPLGVLAILKKNGGTKVRLFVRKPDPDREKWFGLYIRPEKAAAISGVEEVRTLDTWPDWLEKNLTGSVSLYVDGSLPENQRVPVDQEWSDLTPYLIDLRLIKDEEEVAALREAIAITAKGIDRILRAIRPGMYEYQAQALFEYVIADAGSEGPSFETIMASGKNGPILHYETNREVMADGDLVMFDLGARIHGYCGDISRTAPVNGRFSKDQRALYQAVLTAQEAIIQKYRVGTKMAEVQAFTKEILWEEGRKTGLFAPDAAIDDYYYHGVGHSLGVDTHDICENRNLTLAPGMVITCEPGLYIAARNLGIRIEDDILVTEEGPVVLSEMIPKKPDVIENIMKRA